ncbi:hypothetical protein MATL_G00145640 [Megalops atlanticus]|uniref:Uncharacterized protein n=1 Tax=Megalops atlanticus TaxID=7932 RepID=A0A9D3PXA7_MEGAT|nr:hypothetical protein MATL_G00145640 [Megalops atlanticus]
MFEEIATCNAERPASFAHTALQSQRIPRIATLCGFWKRRSRCGARPMMRSDRAVPAVRPAAPQVRSSTMTDITARIVPRRFLKSSK